jgi:copper resistance protein C
MTTDSARSTVRPWEVAARLVALAFAALVVVSAVAAPASAHDSLGSTDPADGSTVETAPAAVVLTFSQEVVALGTEVQVVGPAGQPMNDGPVAVLGTVVTQNLGTDRPAGAYTVQWRATSSDGHPTTGGFTFTATAAVVPVVAPPVVAPLPSATPSETPSATPSASEGTTAVGPADEATPTAEVADGPRGVSVGGAIAGVAAFALAVVSANWWRRRRAGAPQ